MSVVLTTSVVTDSITHQMLGNDCVRASMYDIVWPATSAIVNSQRTFTEMLLDFSEQAHHWKLLTVMGIDFPMLIAGFAEDNKYYSKASASLMFLKNVCRCLRTL